jgi:hypothetical protein
VVGGGVPELRLARVGPSLSVFFTWRFKQEKAEEWGKFSVGFEIRLYAVQTVYSKTGAGSRWEPSRFGHRRFQTRSTASYHDIASSSRPLVSQDPPTGSLNSLERDLNTRADIDTKARLLSTWSVPAA